MGLEQLDPESIVAVTPSVLGWRQERAAKVLSFGEGSALTYRGLLAPEPSVVNTALELAKIGRSTLVPLRIALGQKLVMVPGIYRVVLHNLPASAHVSAGVRAADGTWVIESGGLRDVTIAVMAPLDDSLAIRIEGRSRDSLVWVQMISGPGHLYTTDLPVPAAKSLDPKAPPKLPEIEAVGAAPPVTVLAPLPEVVIAKPGSDDGGRASAIPAAALQPSAAVNRKSDRNRYVIVLLRDRRKSLQQVTPLPRLGVPGSLTKNEIEVMRADNDRRFQVSRRLIA